MLVPQSCCRECVCLFIKQFKFPSRGVNISFILYTLAKVSVFEAFLIWCSSSSNVSLAGDFLTVSFLPIIFLNYSLIDLFSGLRIASHTRTEMKREISFVTWRNVGDLIWCCFINSSLLVLNLWPDFAASFIPLIYFVLNQSFLSRVNRVRFNFQVMMTFLQKYVCATRAARKYIWFNCTPTWFNV